METTTTRYYWNGNMDLGLYPNLTEKEIDFIAKDLKLDAEQLRIAYKENFDGGIVYATITIEKVDGKLCIK